MVYISDEKLKNLPFGPLEKDVHDNLSSSDLDASRTVAHKIADERGVVFGEARRAAFAEKVALRGIRLRDPNTDSSKLTDFDEMVLTGDLKSVEQGEQIREQRRRLKSHFAHIAEFGLEEQEEPEED